MQSIHSKSFRFGALGLATMAALLLPACKKSSSNDKGKSTATSSYSADLAVEWFSLLYDVVKSQGINPPMAARTYGYAGIALYESLVPGMPDHRSLAGQINALDSLPEPTSGQSHHWPTAANAALQTLLSSLVPSLSTDNQDAIDALAESFATSFAADVATDVTDRSVDFGNAIAAAILDYAASDGSDLYDSADYVPPVGPGLWEPTPPAFAAALLPYWGLVRPFFLLPAGECYAGSPPDFSTNPTSDFYAEADEVYTVTGDAGAALTDDQFDIAWFWGDGPTGTGTPPGHWVALTAQILTDEDRDLEDAAEAFARVGMAVHDAFVACWLTKYQENLVRPITYIQDNIDAAWDPLLPTPNFPEFTSGHSTQSGAATVVMQDFFGAVAFEDRTHVEHNPNIVALLKDSSGLRSFSDFLAAADEAAISRLYGGIHYRSAIDLGVSQGRCIGEILLDRIAFRR